MAYITREDGVQFVVPSYRDVLTMKSASALKKEILSLSGNYGEYITLQQKGASQYEVAFSPDTGYLLGESFWQQFKRPLDMVYCEAIPNTTEAILVIVVSGGVYLDGRFQMDSIPDELVVFLTQKNNFEIYVHGDVPICEQPEPGKFCFESNSIKSFTVLDKPVFAELPLLRIYQLQLVETVLKENKIGVLPIKKMVISAIIIAALWFMWSWVTSESETEKQAKLAQKAPEVNPFIEFNRALTSPSPDQELTELLKQVKVLFTMPGWMPNQIDYVSGSMSAKVATTGSTLQLLNDWAKHNEASVTLTTSGVVVSLPIKVASRITPTKIYPLKDIVMVLIDKLSKIEPNIKLRFSGFQGKGAYKLSNLQIPVAKKSTDGIALIGEQFKGLPLIFKGASFKLEPSGMLTGQIIIDAVGN